MFSKSKLRIILSQRWYHLIIKSTLMDLSPFIALNSHTRSLQTKQFAENSHLNLSKTPKEVCSLLNSSAIQSHHEQSSRKVINSLLTLRSYFIFTYMFPTGLLTLIETPTIAGHLICIVDEEHNICKPTAEVKTGIWLSNRFHSANSDG